MKRTALLFAVAAGLGLFALALGFAPTLKGFHVATPPTTVVPPVVQTSGDSLKLTASLSDPYLLPGNQEVFLKLDLDAVRVDGEGRVPVNLALVLDRSGSMAGEKIENARRAARHLVSQLTEKDRFALITFGSDVTTLVNSVVCTPSAKERLHAAIDGIYEIGGTNISGGVEAALAEIAPYRTEFRVSRIILLSDGQANEGVVTPDGLSALSRRVSSDSVSLSSIGVGLDFNENVMELMAEYGGGVYHFLANSDQLADLFGAEFKQTAATVASQPALAITPLHGAQIREVFNYLSEPSGAATAVRLPDFSSGQHRKVVVRLMVPAGAASLQDVAVVNLSYLDVTKNRAQAAANVKVAASITNDPALATSNRNKDVGAAAAHANAIQVMKKASGSYAQGRRDEAQRYIQSAREQLVRAEADYGASEAFDAAKQEATVFEGALAAPASPEAVSNSSKRMGYFANQKR
jgi:Ca-activated chloride channel family protein